MSPYGPHTHICRWTELLEDPIRDAFSMRSFKVVLEVLERFLRAIRIKLWANARIKRCDLLKHQPLPSSDLYDACLEMNWERALQLCQDAPLDAKFQEGDNLETPLYVACQNNPPVELVQAMLEAWPQAAVTKSRVLADLPIHVVCRYFHDSDDIDILSVLVKAYPSTAFQRTRCFETPVSLLWQQASSLCNKEVSMHYANELSHQFAGACIATEILVQTFTEQKQKEKLVSATERQSDKSCTFHTSITLGFQYIPFVAFFYIAQKHCDSNMADDEGRVPLHLAVGPKVQVQYGSPWGKWWSIPVCLMLSPHSACMLDPNEAENRYPLHSALLHGYEWNQGIKDLIRCAPHVLAVVDPHERLYPFQLAAMNNNCTSQHCVVSSDLETLYEVLRSDPSVIEIAKR